MAISAVDNALWDLKAKLLDCSLLDLLGAARESAEIYGSGGFTSYSIEHLQRQLDGWAQEGIKSVKMKIGRDPGADLDRVYAARKAIGPEVQLFVDANGAYSASRPWPRRKSSPSSTYGGLKSRFPPTIWKDCGCCAIALPRNEDRGGRIRLRLVLFPTHACGRSGRCPPSGRHPLRRQ